MQGEILNHPLIAERYFFPRYGSFPDPLWIDVGDCQLACYDYRPHPGAPTLIHFHGNGEIVADYLDGFPQALAAIGLNCILAEFRGYGMSDGRPALGRMLADVEILLRSIAQPPENLILFGRSVGSLFAVHGVSVFPEVGGLILESGVADVLERLLLRLEPKELGVTIEQLAAEVKSRLDQQSKLEQYQGPVLVMHARQDSLIDVSHGVRLCRWAGGEKRLRIFEHGDHNNLLFVNQRDYFAEVAAYLTRHFQKST